MTPVNYDEFIASKAKRRVTSGFEPMPIKANLFDWQKSVVNWAIRNGSAALFEECGLGKTVQQLEWARQVSAHTESPVLILTPLAVAQQTMTESKRFGIPAQVVQTQREVKGPGVWITNYEKLEHFEPSSFSGVVLDESSILKALTGKTRIALTEAFGKTPARGVSGRLLTCSNAGYVLHKRHLQHRRLAVKEARGGRVLEMAGVLGLLCLKAVRY
jgi:hypothetical protein